MAQEAVQSSAEVGATAVASADTGASGVGPASNGNTVVSRTVNAPPEAVWAVLSDGWLYATWVVGASRIRQVDLEWPKLGSRIHHSFGMWPAVIDDVSEVLRSAPPVGDQPGELLLRAKGWPVGEAQVLLRIEPAPWDHSRISIVEDVTAGPGRIIPRPVRQLGIAPRNKEALQRLGLIAEGQYRARMG